MFKIQLALDCNEPSGFGTRTSFGLISKISSDDKVVVVTRVVQGCDAAATSQATCLKTNLSFTAWLRSLNVIQCI